MFDFNTAVNLFKNDKIRELSATAEGMRFLKLRSLSRKEHLDYLINEFEIDIGTSSSNNERLRLLYLEKVNTDVGFQLDFYWDGETYSTEADVIFVTKR